MMYGEQEDRVVAAIDEIAVALTRMAVAMETLAQNSDQAAQRLAEEAPTQIELDILHQRELDRQWAFKNPPRARVRVQDPMDKFNAPKTTSADPNEDFFGPVTNHGGIK